MNPSIQFKKPTSLFVIALMLAWFALPQKAAAVVPPPDGGYPGGNTAEGENALLNLTTGGFKHGSWLANVEGQYSRRV